MACPASLQESVTAASAFDDYSIKLSELSSIQNDTILNRLLGMSLEVQHTIFSYTTFLSGVKKTPNVSCFFNFIRNRAGPSVICDMDDVRTAKFSEGAEGVQIIVSYSPYCAEFPENARIWKHSRSNHVVWIKDNTMISADGHKQIIEDTSDVCIANKGYIEATEVDWNRAVHRSMIWAKKRCRKLPKSYFIATNNAMNCWKDSLHRVLRIPPCIQFPKGLIGLLVYIS